MKRSTVRLSPAILITALFCACASSTPEPSEAKRARDEESPASGGQGRLSDAQLVGVVRALNDVQVEQALLAKSIASLEQVRQYAALVAADHATSNERLSELTQRFQIIPVESRESRTLRERNREILARLRPLSGEELDRTYMSLSIAGQQQALDLLDEITPDTANNELAVVLGDLRSQVAAHLVRARQLTREPPLAAR